MITKFNSYLNEKLPIGERLNETIINPNFSIVVPGGCNGKCSFCFWKQSKVCENYIGNLVETLNSMPSQFYQLSLTGGEPTMSPYLDKILENIDRTKWKHTVLTTNGTNILKYISKLEGKIDHINISRHHYDDVINESIFGTDTVPDSKKLRTIVTELNKVGIDVTYSAVLTEELNSKEGAEKYIAFAKRSGAKQVFLRKPHGSLDASKAEKAFEHLPSSTHNCPVCRNTTQKINGITVVWKASLEEPSKSLGMIYETIYHEDGTLTSDWEQEIKIKPTLIKENSNNLLESCGGGSDSGCGSGSSSDDELTQEEKDDAKRQKLLAKRKKKIGKIENKLKEKTISKNRDGFYGGGWVSTFDSFEYKGSQGIYECGGGSSSSSCGGGSYSSCGSYGSSSRKKKNLNSCGSEIGGCGGGSSIFSGGRDEDEEDYEEVERQKLLKHRKKVLSKVKKELKKRDLPTEEKPKNKPKNPRDNFYGGGFTSSFSDFTKK